MTTESEFQEPVAPEMPMVLPTLLLIRVGWKDHFEGRTHPAFRTHSVYPEPGWPVGRKGLMLARIWQQVATPEVPGMVINDGDVIIDPVDLGALWRAAALEPEAVHTAPVRLWPCATGLPAWIWGHRQLLPPGTPNDTAMAAWQSDIDTPEMFTFGLTYLPQRLIEGAIKSAYKGGLAKWIYPHVDEYVSRTARELGIPIRVVRDGCGPRHVNY